MSKKLGLVLIPLFFSLLVFSGCKTAPPVVPTNQVLEGQWRGKALIKDLTEKKSYVVALNMNAQKNKRARMDVMSTLGTGVASLLVDEKEVRYIILSEKKFYIGVPQAEAMKPILIIPFDPRWLHNILFEQPFLDKSWSCTTEKNGQLNSCLDSLTGLKISWLNRDGDKRTILLEHAKASVQINVASFKPKVEDRKGLFTLEPPNGFRKFRIH